MTSTITATTYDATYGAVSVTKRTSRAFTHAVVRVADDGAVSGSFHMTRAAAERAAGKPAPGITRHVVSVDNPRARPCGACNADAGEPCRADCIGAAANDDRYPTVVELPAVGNFSDAMRAELSRGVMVAWINADLLNRADCDVRRSVVLWTAEREFVMALGVSVTAEIFRDRIAMVADSMAAIGIRYWSVGIR